MTFTAELDWGKVMTPLARHFRVIALDLGGHGDGTSTGPLFRLEDCADDVAALAGTLGIGRFVAVGYSMGGSATTAQSASAVTANSRDP